MVTTNSDAENYVPTDVELKQTGMDVKILRDLHHRIIVPRLKHMSGFDPMGVQRDKSEDLGLWMMALDVKQWSFRSIHAIRLTQPAIELHSEQGRDFGILVFLTRDGEYITAIRQKLEKPRERQEEIYMVSNFEYQGTIGNLDRWLDEFSTRLAIPPFDSMGQSIIMQIFRSLQALLDDTAAKRRDALEKIENAQREAGNLLVNART